MMFPDIRELRRRECEEGRRLDELMEKELQKDDEERRRSFCIHTPKESMSRLGGKSEDYHF